MLDALAPLKDMLSGEVVTLDEKTVNLRLPAQNIAHRLLYNLTNFSTYFVYWPSGSASAAASVELVDPNRHALTLRDPLRKSTAPLASEWSDATRLLTFTVPATDRPLIVETSTSARRTCSCREATFRPRDPCQWRRSSFGSSRPRRAGASVPDVHRSHHDVAAIPAVRRRRL
jgi:hypothetical protein